MRNAKCEMSSFPHPFFSGEDGCGCHADARNPVLHSLDESLLLLRTKLTVYLRAVVLTAGQIVDPTRPDRRCVRRLWAATKDCLENENKNQNDNLPR
jgi:hypothetical protein